MKEYIFSSREPCKSTDISEYVRLLSGELLEDSYIDDVIKSELVKITFHLESCNSCQNKVIDYIKKLAEDGNPIEHSTYAMNYQCLKKL